MNDSAARSPSALGRAVSQPLDVEALIAAFRGRTHRAEIPATREHVQFAGRRSTALSQAIAASQSRR